MPDAQAIAEAIAVDLWTNHDANTIERVFAPDAVYRDVAFGYTFSGHEQILAYFNQVTGSMADFAETLHDVLEINATTFTSRWHYSGTFRDGLVERSIDLPGSSVVTVRDGLVVTCDDYYSGNAFLACLGYENDTVEKFKARKLTANDS